MGAIDTVAQARASFARCSWGDAYEQFAKADARTLLDLDDLEKLALAAYLSDGTRTPRSPGPALSNKPCVATIRSALPGTPSWSGRH